MQTMRWIGIAACAAIAVSGLVGGIMFLTEGLPKEAASNWSFATLFAGFAGVLWRRGGLRWTGITVGAVLAVVGLVAGIFYLTEGLTKGVVWSWTGAALFAVFAGVLWRLGRHSPAASTENGQLPE